MIFILIICVYALDIHFQLPRRDIRCFSDRLQQEEILTGKVISDTSTFSLKIVDSETSKQLHYTFNEIEQSFKIVPTKATSIQFCIHNMDNFVIKINLKYETGLEELDYSKEAQMQDFVEIKQYISHLTYGYARKIGSKNRKGALDIEESHNFFFFNNNIYDHCHFDINVQSQTYSKGQEINLIFIMKKFNLEQYELQQTISLGTYFRMRVAKPKQGNKLMQIKTYRKQDLLKLEIQKTHLTNEISILSNIHMNSPFIIQYHGYAVDQRYVYLLFEHLPYGDIFRRQLTNIQFYISQVVLALLHLQKLQIIHRDIKLENFCMAEDGYIKLVDFTFAKVVKTKYTTTLCGTPECSAPEIIAQQPYDFSVDFWSLGVLIFELIDESPFYDEDTYQIYKKILYGKPKYSKKFNTTSKSLCKQLLSRDPKQRLSKSIQDHDFFQSINWGQIEAKKIKPPFVPLKSEIQYYQTYPESDGRAEEPKEDPFFNW